MIDRGKELAAEYAKNAAEMTPEQRAEREATGYWDVTIDLPATGRGRLGGRCAIYDDRTGEMVLDAQSMAIEVTGSRDRLVIRRLNKAGREDETGEWVAENGDGGVEFVFHEATAECLTIRAALKWKEKG